MRITFVGSGDAFGAGGRLQTCLHVVAPNAAPILVDCGATALIGLKRLGLATDAIDAAVITHLHGDHFSGLVWLLLDGVFGTKRRHPLAIYGPPTTRERLRAAIDVLYPGALAQEQGLFHVTEMRPGTPTHHGAYRIDALEVDHPSGAPSFGVRVTAAGRAFAFTGDTAWTEAVVELGRGAHVYVMDCWEFEGVPKVHMSFHQIKTAVDRLEPKRLILTHMGERMLAEAQCLTDPRFSAAHDGLVIDV